MTSISPMELWKSAGITSYICGQSGQRISESYYMLKHALEYQSPQVVLLETNMLFRYTNTPDSLRSSISDTAMYYFPVLQYHNLWKNIVNDQIPEGWQSYKGFAIRPGVAPYSKGSYMKKTKKEKEIPWFLAFCKAADSSDTFGNRRAGLLLFWMLCQSGQWYA